MTAPAPKGPVPLGRWVLWWSIMAPALVVFYVLLPPVWLAIRAAAWAAELQGRRRR